MKTQQATLKHEKRFSKIILTLVSLILVGTSLFGQKVDITGDATVTGQLTIMDTILFADGTELASACLQVLADSDFDTKIEVEKVADEDMIRFTIEGIEIARFINNRLELADGGGSVFIGFQAGASDDATNNKGVYIGYETGELSNGFGNVAVGANAMTENASGVENVSIGASAGYQSEGSNNVFVGRDAGRVSATGSENTYVGHDAGRTATGSGNVFLGKSAGEVIPGSNKLAIDNTNTNTPLIYGEFDNNLVRINGKLNINNAYDLPESAGASGQVLSYDGSGAVQWVNPSATSSFSDADGDTKIQVEKLVDEDKIHFTVGGYEAMYLDTVSGNGRLNIDAHTFTQKPLTLYDSDIYFKSTTQNSQLGINWGSNGLGFQMSNIKEDLGGGKLNLRYTLFATIRDVMTWDNTGFVGIGTQDPLRALHVLSDSPSGHVMRIENQSSSAVADGLEIVINRATTGGGNNFITFRDADGVAGRIEGFNIADGNGFADFPNIDFSVYFNPVTIRNIAFDKGEFPEISGGELPSLQLVLPTFDFQWPTLNYTPPTLTGGVASFSTEIMSTCAFSAGLNCSNPFSWTPINFQDGNLSYDPGYGNWQGGGYNWDSGELPTLSEGQLPSFDIDAIINPLPILSASNDFKTVICWALENGERSLVTTNPWDLAMLENASYLNNLADCKNGGVTYGSGGADYAEYLLRENFEEHIEEGQIVGVKGGKITKKTEDAEQLLVISMMPIVLGNMPDDTLTLDQYEKVAFLGQAPVWVVGKVRSGDYIIPSGHDDGYGIAVAPEELKLEHISKVVGRAWSDADEVVNLVNMVIGLKTNEMASILSRTSKKVDALETRMAQIETALGLNEVASKE